MTSIHASIPPDLRGAVSAAKRRGEVLEISMQVEGEQRPMLKAKSASSSDVDTKKLPQRLTGTHPEPLPWQIPQGLHVLGGKEDEKSASKGNDPALSPVLVPEPSPRQCTLAKQPLSDLPCPTESDEDEMPMCLGPSERNTPQTTTHSLVIDNKLRKSQLVEKTSIANLRGRIFKDLSVDNRTVLALGAVHSERERPTKRVCSDDTKENKLAGSSVMSQVIAPQLRSVSVKLQSTYTRKASATGALRGPKAGKPRVGLRRL
ncbi:MAG: hypothetical protein Q9217_001262 [Psora testacea]